MIMIAQNYNENTARVLAENSEYQYSLEVQREHSIIEQTGKMLVIQSLFSTALYAALPSILACFDGQICSVRIIWFFVCVLSVLLVADLGITLAAQARYSYQSIPTFEQLEAAVSAMPDNAAYWQIKYAYNREHVMNMVHSLEEINARRCRFLKMAMVVFASILFLTLIMIICLVSMK